MKSTCLARTGIFTVVDAVGKLFTIIEYTKVMSIYTGVAFQDVIDHKELRTTDGQLVKEMDNGEYEVILRPEKSCIVHRYDPDARGNDSTASRPPTPPATIPWSRRPGSGGAKGTLRRT
jgi:hypothetical protein